MFTSAGIDNFELRLAVTLNEAKALRKACDWLTKDGDPILLRNEHSPLILLQFAPGKVLANLNVPKLNFEHNVWLGGPGEIENAVRILSTNTAPYVKRLDWNRAIISRLHVTFTLEVPDFEACAKLCKAPRGTWMKTEFYPNVYLNANSKNTPVIVYDKARHLREAELEMPNDVTCAMDFSGNALFRFEARLNQSVNAELKKRGGWNRLSFLAEDLFGAGFLSALRYLQWRFNRNLPIPIDRTAKAHPGMSAREYVAYNVRETANENPARMRERAGDDHNAGSITSEMLRTELARIAVHERRALALSLHAALEKAVKQTGKIFIL